MDSQSESSVTWYQALASWLPSTEGLGPVFRKEMGDHLTSARFLIIFVLVALAGLSSTYVATQTIADTLRQAANQSQTFATSPMAFIRIFTTSGGQLPSFLTFVSLLGPLLGITLGFDAINGERSSGNLSRVVSQPVYRDSIINGKFLAGLTIITMMIAALMLIIAGMTLLVIGLPPSFQEVLRLLAFLVLTIIYVAFWLGISLLCSVLFRQSTTSALATIGLWLFLTLFASLLAGIIADAAVPQGQNATVAQQLAHQRIQLYTQRLSPDTLYQEATSVLLTPEARTVGVLSLSQYAQLQQGGVPGQLSFAQSLLLIWPHVVALLAGTALMFGLAYVVFIRQEIRAT